jgi:signal peptidase
MRVARRVLAGLLFGALTATGAFLWYHGERAYVVHTGSMSPAYRPGDLLIDGPPSHVRPGEVITFRHSDLATDVVTHRVTEIRGGIVHTKGDANPTDDTWDIRSEQIRGVVAMRVPRLGYLVVFLKQPAGIGAVLTGTAALVLLFGLFFPATPPTADPTADPIAEPAATP